MEDPWYVSLFVESIKATAGVAGTVFGLIGGFAYLAMSPVAWQCWDGRKASFETALCNSKVVEVPFFGESAGTTAALQLGALGVGAGLILALGGFVAASLAKESAPPQPG